MRDTETRELLCDSKLSAFNQLAAIFVTRSEKNCETMADFEEFDRQAADNKG